VDTAEKGTLRGGNKKKMGEIRRGRNSKNQRHFGAPEREMKGGTEAVAH